MSEFVGQGLRHQCGHVVDRQAFDDTPVAASLQGTAHAPLPRLAQLRDPRGLLDDGVDIPVLLVGLVGHVRPTDVRRRDRPASHEVEDVQPVCAVRHSRAMGVGADGAHARAEEGRLHAPERR